MESHDVIRRFIQQHLLDAAPDREIEDSADIFDLGFVSSLFAVQLITFLQDDFGIRVENDDIHLSNFRSVNAIVNFIRTKQGNRP